MQQTEGNLRKYADWGITFLLSIILGYMAASMSVLIIERSLITPPRMAISKPVKLKQEKTRTLSEYLQRLRPLFPEAKPKGESFSSPENQSGSESQTDSSMSLVATIIGERASIAVLELGDSRKIVTDGEIISGYAVKRITRDRVILEKNGKQKVLWMRFEPLNDKKAENQVPDRNKKDAKTDTVTEVVSRREFNAAIDQPNILAPTISFAPVTRGEKQYGIQIKSIKPGSLMEKMGFHQGDIIVTLNRKSVYSPEEIFMIYQTLKNEEEADFAIDRGGKSIQLHIVFR